MLKSNVISISANRDGNLGILVEVKHSDDIKKYKESLPWDLSHENLIALVAANDFSKELLHTFETNDDVQGILLVKDGTRPFYGWSEDGFSPNEQFCKFFDFVILFLEYRRLHKKLRNFGKTFFILCLF